MNEEGMGKIALYRKYRPAKLSEVVGQDHITTVLGSAIKNGNISHAYLLTGQRGTGKTTVARILAHEVNQIPYEQESFDIIEIDAASHGLKEDIKELIEKSVIAPIRDRYKVYIIDEVHSMKHDAFNTFLKLLEEPPAHVVFILATTDPQKLPPTILSRTQRFHFRPIELEKVAKSLRKIAEKEKIDISDEAVRVIAERGGGSFRDSLSLLDQLGGLGGKIDVETVENILGLASDKAISGLVEAVVGHNSTEVIKILNQLESAGVAGRTVVDQLVKKLLQTAGEQPSLFGLIDKLIDSVSAFNIYLKLLAILASYSSVEQKYVAPKPLEVEPVKPVISEPVIASSPPVIASEAKQSSNKPLANEQTTTGSRRLKPRDDSPPKEINWNDFVKAVSNLNKTCGSSLTNASHDYDGETLTLYFTSKIFRDKMKDSKWKSALKNALIELYEQPPIIDIADGAKPKNATVSAVADIMGGGEVL
jgi:DNA polymerase-3 subunit gamma/tau